MAKPANFPVYVYQNELIYRDPYFILYAIYKIKYLVI